MTKAIEKTINADAIVFNILEGKDDEEMVSLLDVNTLERDVVIFDLTKTEYISSKFIGILVSFQQSITTAGKKMLISGVSPTVKQVFDCMGLFKVFKVLE